MDLGTALDHLYSVPLSDFTRERDRLASSLKDQGDAEAASSLKAKRKPTLVAWAVNQLARADAGTIESLLRTRDELVDAGSATRMRELAAERRRVISTLRRAAQKLLESSGHSASTQTLDRIALTLEAVATDEDADLLRSGRLATELSPGGFDALGVGPAAPGAAGPDAEEQGPTTVDRRRTRKLLEAARAAAERADRLTRAAEDAARAAAEAAESAARARREADDAMRRAESEAADVGLSLEDL